MTCFEKNPNQLLIPLAYLCRYSTSQEVNNSIVDERYLLNKVKNYNFLINEIWEEIHRVLKNDSVRSIKTWSNRIFVYFIIKIEYMKE
jgi:hypothetical protein